MIEPKLQVSSDWINGEKIPMGRELRPEDAQAKLKSERVGSEVDRDPIRSNHIRERQHPPWRHDIFSIHTRRVPPYPGNSTSPPSSSP